jgi:hypothetical protein
MDEELLLTRIAVQKECFASAKVKGSKLVQKRRIAEHMQLPPVRIIQHFDPASSLTSKRDLGWKEHGGISRNNSVLQDIC